MKITEFKLEDLYADIVEFEMLERIAERVREIDEEMNGIYYESVENWNVARIEMNGNRMRVRMESETIPKQVRFMSICVDWLFKDEYKTFYKAA